MQRYKYGDRVYVAESDYTNINDWGTVIGCYSTESFNGIGVLFDNFMRGHSMNDLYDKLTINCAYDKRSSHWYVKFDEIVDDDLTYISSNVMRF